MENFCNFLKHKKFGLACSFLENDINNLDRTISSIENGNIEELKKRMKLDSYNLNGLENVFLMCCLYSIVSNPFNFYNLLPEKDCEIVLDFCIQNLFNFDLKKLAICTLVHFSKDKILLNKSNGKYFIQQTCLSPVIAYSILSEYSKIVKVPVNFDKIDTAIDFDFNKEKNCEDSILKSDGFYFLNNNDGHIIMSEKINILTNQVKYFDIKKQVLEDFTNLLNYQNVSVGWAVSNAIAKLSKYFENDSFVSSLVGKCTDIFANENLWINTLTILGILALKGVEIGDTNSLIKKALLYDNEFVYVSSLIREHALFLIWSLLQNYILNPDKTKKDKLLSSFDLLVFVYVFDNVYNVRKAASSVIVEFVGVFEIENGSEWLLLIDKNYHKRIENCNSLLQDLSRFYNVNNFREEDLSIKLDHHNLLTKEFVSYFIVNFYKSTDFFYNFDFNLSKNKIGLLYILYYSLKKGKRDVYDFKLFFTSFKIDDKLYKTRNSNVLIYLYLSCLILFLSKQNLTTTELNELPVGFIQDNLYYILSKNIFPKETSFVCWALATPIFTNKLLKGMRRNTESFILVNTRCDSFPLELYKQNLLITNLDVRIATYKSLKYVKQLDIFKEEILKGLNDYSIDKRGDISYKIRLESLYLAIHLNLDVEKVFIRYLVDKSKYLRDYCLTLICYLNLYENDFTSVYIKDKKFINFEIKQTNLNQELEDFIEIRNCKSNFSTTFKSFIDRYKQALNFKLNEGLTQERSYFTSMLEASNTLPLDYQWEFYNGICSTVINSNKQLSECLVDILIMKKDIIENLTTLKPNQNYVQVLEIIQNETS